MDLSNATDKLFKGLSTAQQQMEQPTKDGEANAGSYTYKYATLTSVINAVKKAIKGTGIGYTQNIVVNDGAVSVSTIVFHETGANLVFDPVIIGSTKRAQDIGSAISYARRYSLQTAFAIAAEEDDDGQRANNGYSDQKQSQQRNQNYGQQSRGGNKTRQHGSQGYKKSNVSQAAKKAEQSWSQTSNQSQGQPTSKQQPLSNSAKTKLKLIQMFSKRIALVKGMDEAGPACEVIKVYVPNFDGSDKAWNSLDEETIGKASQDLEALAGKLKTA